jgi:murein DD-endopeptidase / murein LD-carboxypeptidase
VKSVALFLLVLIASPVFAANPPRSDEELIAFMAKNEIPFDSLCTQMDLYREIITWIGVPYKYAGKTPKGVDCSGFVAAVCNRIYGTQLGGSAGEHYKKCREIGKDELEEGDLVFFKIRKPYISHVGLYLGNGRFIHAAVHGGVMINHLSEKYYSTYYFASGRLL